MRSILLVGLLLATAFVSLAPTASAQDLCSRVPQECEIAQEAVGCVEAIATGGEYSGNYFQCGGAGSGGCTDPRCRLLTDVRGCVGALESGDPYYGYYLACA